MYYYKKNNKIYDLLLYLSSFISLIFITILLSSSKTISYNIDLNNNNSNENNNKNRIISIENHRDITKKKAEIVENRIIIKKNKKISKNNINNNLLDYTQINQEKKVKIINNNLKKDYKIIKNKKIHYTVKYGDTLWSLSKRFNISLYKLINDNNIKNPRALRVGEVLIIVPGKNNNSIKKNQKKYTFNYRRSKRRKFKLIWPLRGRVTSGFGVRISPYSKKMEFHTGVDIGVPVGTKIHAAENGRVIFTGIKGGYGITIIISHKKGYKTLYGHCLISYVKKGAYVRKGQVIGKVGLTGITTGPHLHFEIRKNNVAIDPFTVLNKRYLYF